ncbi:MAG TPA: thiamine pyrophosphate-dependent enzyme [Candidatus Woesebacteria bacterium]|nr:thiamine pyrophosphate-dependent enzyme [Candidatus Woesebacteria bacterium]
MNLKSKIIPTFCPGCNNYILMSALHQAIEKLAIDPKKLVLVFDIGCIGNMADFFSCPSIHGLHGRSIPTAVGVKLADPSLTVIAIGGDGGIYGEGMGHLIASARANYPITTIVANNQLYSLTTGQTSPTSPKGSKTKSTPTGSISEAFLPSTLSSLNKDIIVNSVDGTDLQKLTETIVKSIQHPGFSLVDVSQVCVTFHKQLG